MASIVMNLVTYKMKLMIRNEYLEFEVGIFKSKEVIVKNHIFQAKILSLWGDNSCNIGS
jgi:hypothetical protein